jgi:hypothetical protein
MAPAALQFAMAAMDAGEITDGSILNHKLWRVRALLQATFNVKELPTPGMIFQMPFKKRES